MALAVTLAADHGGFFPTAWNWATLVALVGLAAVVIESGAARLARGECAMLALLALLIGWTALSLVWTDSVSRGVPELQRDLAYLTVLACLFLLSRRAPLPAVLVIAVSVVCVWSLVTYTPSRLDVNEGRLLIGWIGYANGLGAVAAIALPVALGLTCNLCATTRAVGCGAIPLVSAVLYLTQSRGAWIAACAGVAVVLYAAPRRGTTLRSTGVAVPGCVAALAVCWAIDPLAAGSDPSIPLLAGVVITAGILGATAGAMLGTGTSDAVGPPRAALAAGAIALATLVAATAVTARSTHPRAQYWRVAWHEYTSHPVLGSGPGTYARYWLEQRTTPTSTQEAHSLYVETLAELGPIGLAVVLSTLGVAFISRLGPLDVQAAGALGGYVAFVVHAGFDWDWELPFVTVIGLGAAAALLTRAPVSTLGPAVRRIGVSAGLTVAAAAMLALVGNLELNDADRNANDGNWPVVVERARTAMRWQPWSSQPHLLRGRAYLALGDLASARRAFIAATERDASDWRGWYGLALATKRIDRKHALEVAARLNPLAVVGPRR